MNHRLRGFENPPASIALLVQLHRLQIARGATPGNAIDVMHRRPEITERIMTIAGEDSLGLMNRESTPAERLVLGLGLSQVLKYAALVGFDDLRGSVLDAYGEDWAAFQRRSTATALLMEFMAHDVTENPGQAFLLGLFHGIGQLPIARALSKLKPITRSPNPTDFMEVYRWERGEIGTDHARLGGRLLEAWGFPETVSHPILVHLHPMLTARYKRVAGMLHISRLVSRCIIQPDRYAFTSLDIPVGLLKLCDIRKPDIAAHLPNVAAWFRSSHEWTREEAVIA